MDELSALQSLGLTLPGPWYIAGAIVFGLVGMVAWRYGSKQARPRTKWLGIALCFYPYAIERTWLLYVVGIALCIGIYIDSVSIDR